MVNDFSESTAAKFLSKLSNGSGGSSLIRDGEYSLSTIAPSYQVVLVLYNSLAWKFTQVIKSSSNRSDLVVYDTNSNLLESQVNPIEQPFKYPRKYIFYFLINDIPPLSMMTLFIQQNSQLTNVGNVISRSDGLGEMKQMGSGCYTFAWYDGMFDSSFSFCYLCYFYFIFVLFFFSFMITLDD